VAIRAVTFDAAGTLIGVAEPVGRTYARLARRYGMEVGAGEAGRRFHLALAAAPPLAFHGASPTERRDHERAWWHALVRRALAPADGDARFDPAFEELFAHYAGASAWGHGLRDSTPCSSAGRPPWTQPRPTCR
jgi:putative hydrolase of the HAD superfamily